MISERFYRLHQLKNTGLKTPLSGTKYGQKINRCLKKISSLFYLHCSKQHRKNVIQYYSDNLKYLYINV